MKYKRIIFLESEADADGYLSDSKAVGRESGDLFIAMNPNVRAYLLRKGYAANDTSSYFSNLSHKEALVRLQFMTDWLDEKVVLGGFIPGVSVAYKGALIFWIRASASYFLWVIEIVSKAIAAHEPEEIVAHITPEGGNRMGYLVRLIAEKNGILFRDIRRAGGDGEPSGGKSRPVETTGLIARYLRFEAWKFLLWARGKCKKTVFITSPLYKMDALASELSAELKEIPFRLLRSPVIPGFDVPCFIAKMLYNVSQEDLDKERGSIDAVIKDISLRGDLFSFRDIPFADALSEKIRAGISSHVIGLMLWAVQLERAIDLLDPLAFISNGTRDDNNLLAEICLKKNIGTIVVSHGSHVPPKHELERIEWRSHGKAFLDGSFSCIASQSPLAEMYFSEYYSPSRLLRTGPVIWGNPVRKFKDRETFEKIAGPAWDMARTRVVVHAGTPKPSSFLRFHVYETPDEYIGALRQLAAAVEEIKDALLIIRFRPSPDISIETVRALVPSSDKVRFSTGGTFESVLGLADLLVSFSSTTIEEALQNRVPVLQYGGGGRYQHVGAEDAVAGGGVKPNAVYHVGKAIDLGYAISSILDLGIERHRDAGLFSRYIYPAGSREPLGVFLSALSSGKKEGLCI